MDSTTKTACFDEISHTICDLDKKVSKLVRKIKS